MERMTAHCQRRRNHLRKSTRRNTVGCKVVRRRFRLQPEVHLAHFGLYRRLGRLALGRLAADLAVRLRGRGPVLHRCRPLPSGFFIALSLGFDPPDGGVFGPVTLAFLARRSGFPVRLALPVHVLTDAFERRDALAGDRSASRAASSLRQWRGPFRICTSRGGGDDPRRRCAPRSGPREQAPALPTVVATIATDATSLVMMAGRCTCVRPLSRPARTGARTARGTLRRGNQDETAASIRVRRGSPGWNGGRA